MQYAKPVTLNVEECDRLSFLPYLFGNDFLYAEAYVYALAQKMMPEYQGGFWHFIRLPDGGGYMMPDGDRFHLVNGENWFDRTVSADAAGIILTSLVINRQLWLYHDSGDIRAAGSDERRELTHAVMRELDAPDNWTMNGEYGSEFGGFFPVQVRFTPAHERFHLALCSPGDVSQVWVLVLVNAGGEPFAVVQVQRRFASEAVSHSLALAASLDTQGYSVNDIIHILMAEGGQV